MYESLHQGHAPGLGPGPGGGIGDVVPLTLVVPLLPGQGEPWRRFVQELQGSRHAEFAAARRRWGLRTLALWLVPARPAELVVAQLVPAAGRADAADAAARLAHFARSGQPFDQWLREQVRALHGVDLSGGVARYRATFLAMWPEEAPPAEGRLPPGP